MPFCGNGPTNFCIAGVQSWAPSSIVLEDQSLIQITYNSNMQNRLRSEHLAEYFLLCLPIEADRGCFNTQVLDNFCPGSGERVDKTEPSELGSEQVQSVGYICNMFLYLVLREALVKAY